MRWDAASPYTAVALEGIRTDRQGSSWAPGRVHTHGSVPTTFLRGFRRQRGKTFPANRRKPNSQCPPEKELGRLHPHRLPPPRDPRPLLIPGPERHGPVAGAHPPVRAATHHRVSHCWLPRGREDKRSEWAHQCSADERRRGTPGNSITLLVCLCSQVAAMSTKVTRCFQPGCGGGGGGERNTKKKKNPQNHTRQGFIFGIKRKE